jgi:cytochrome c oxidase cbb3-type subunit 3
MGESVFIAECKVCHGADGKGLGGKAANLHHRISAENVKHVVNNGSNHQLLGFEMPMPDRNGLFNANTGALITDAEIDAVAAYVANGFKGNDKGAEVFGAVCSSCHGADGKGMEGVAPDLHEFAPAMVVNVLTHGKKGAIGTMPSFDRLNVKQKEAAASYISAGLPDTDDLEGE